MSEVWKHSKARESQLLVLLAVADRARKEDGCAWPGVRTIAGQARISERQAQYHLRALTQMGELRLVRPGGRGPADSAVYQVTVGAYKGALAITLKGATGCTLKGAIKRPKGAMERRKRVQPIAPDPLVDPLSEPGVVTDEKTGRLRLVAGKRATDA